MYIEIEEDGTYKLNGKPVEVTRLDVLGHTVEAIFHKGSYFPVTIPDKGKNFQQELKKVLHNPNLWEDK